MGVAIAPRKTNAPLLVDADAVLPPSIASQRLKSISWQARERSNIGSGVQHVQFPKGLAFDGPEPADGFPAEETLGVGAAERPNHTLKVYCYSLYVKQYGL
jgi:hypothetical protein